MRQTPRPAPRPNQRGDNKSALLHLRAYAYHAKGSVGGRRLGCCVLNIHAGCCDTLGRGQSRGIRAEAVRLDGYVADAACGGCDCDLLEELARAT
jgi:hypothetical protein